MIATKTIKPDRAPQSLPAAFTPAPQPSPCVPITLRLVTYEDIAAEVCLELSVSPEQLHDHTRHRNKILARDIVVYLCRRMTNLSFPEIAEKMKRHGHSTCCDQNLRMARRLEICEMTPDKRYVAAIVANIRARVLMAIKPEGAS